ncbi:MAG: hypothetical protein AAF721_14855 [Myxococcota bacterium]
MDDTGAESTSGGLLDADSDGGDKGLDSLCDVFAQDCLPGLKCTLKFEAALELGTACVEVRGSGTVGDVCQHEGFASGLDTCDSNSACVGVTSFGGGWTGTCRSFCGGTLDDGTCEDPATSCGGGTLPLCLQRCDPLLQDCVGEFEGCYLNNNIEGFQCIALSENQVGLGESCSFGTACLPGLMCRDPDVVPGCDTNCCAEFCDASEPNMCTLADQGAQCVRVGAIEPEFADVGLCVLPD